MTRRRRRPPLDLPTTRALVSVGQRALARVEPAGTSRQPRFKLDRGRFWAAVLRLTGMADLEEPDYASASSRRDAWLRQLVRLEPHLGGVLGSVVAIDKNRGWSVTGGRNQVNRVTALCHAADGGSGWRRYLSLQSQSFWGTDLGAVTELGRDGAGGPLRALYHVDPVCCTLTGAAPQPLDYAPAVGGGVQHWGADDFFRCCSLPNPAESFHQLGWCAVSRCVTLARIMVAIYRYQEEKLAARAPRGLLLLNNISETQWTEAMQTKADALDGLERRYFDAVSVIAQEGPYKPEATLVALSQLPDNFDLKLFTDLLMYGYALSFGFDPSEFWPVQFGALGRGTETEVQHAKATGKGGLDFALDYQEQLVAHLPDTVLWEFDQRDLAGDLQEIGVRQAQADFVTSLYEAGLQWGAPLIEKEQALQLLVDEGLVPEEWSLASEQESVATDTQEAEQRRVRERLLDALPVRRACARFAGEPIVRCEWRHGTVRERVLWASGDEALARRRWPAAKVARTAAGVLYESPEVTITESDIDAAIKDARRRNPTLADLLEAKVVEE